MIPSEQGRFERSSSCAQGLLEQTRHAAEASLPRVHEAVASRSAQADSACRGSDLGLLGLRPKSDRWRCSNEGALAGRNRYVTDWAF